MQIAYYLLTNNLLLMKYKLIEKANPQNREQKKFYASAVNIGKKDIKAISKEIAGRSSLTRGDIENVLINFIDELPTYLKDGFSVKLGDFGTMRLSLSSEGAELAKDFKSTSIKPKVVFTPGKEVKDAISKIEYVRITE